MAGPVGAGLTGARLTGARRIMMVDDSKTTRTMVAFTLRRAGYEVVEAEDGKAALALLDREPADIVITDLNMPGMDGLTLIRALRTRPGYKTTPIVMLTTAGDAANKEAGRQAGATGLLGKPFHPTALVQMVTKILEGVSEALGT
jgi:two-component system chemotaxis response regulator CheY